MDRHTGAGDGEIETLLDHRREIGLSETHQALVIAVQTPDILGMLEGSRQRVIESEIGAVDRFGLLNLPCSSSRRPVGVARRLHPAPRLVVGQSVVEFDRFAQVGKGCIEVAFAILQFAIQHLGQR